MLVLVLVLVVVLVLVMGKTVYNKKRGERIKKYLGSEDGTFRENKFN